MSPDELRPRYLGIEEELKQLRIARLLITNNEVVDIKVKATIKGIGQQGGYEYTVESNIEVTLPKDMQRPDEDDYKLILVAIERRMDTLQMEKNEILKKVMY